MTKSVRIVQEFAAIEDEAQSWSIPADASNIPMHQYTWLRRASRLLPATEDCIVHNLTSWGGCLPETFRFEAAAEGSPKRLRKPQASTSHWRALGKSAKFPSDVF
jgi:hypothetical protein